MTWNASSRRLRVRCQFNAPKRLTSRGIPLYLFRNLIWTFLENIFKAFFFDENDSWHGDGKCNSAQFGHIDIVWNSGECVRNFWLHLYWTFYIGRAMQLVLLLYKCHCICYIWKVGFYLLSTLAFHWMKAEWKLNNEILLNSTADKVQ